MNNDESLFPELQAEVIENVNKAPIPEKGIRYLIFATYDDGISLVMPASVERSGYFFLDNARTVAKDLSPRWHNIRIVKVNLE